MAVDLLFKKPPASSNNLLFGEPENTDLVVTLYGTLPVGISLAGTAVVGRPAGAQLEGDLVVAVAMTGGFVYSSNTARPLVNRTSESWQQAAQLEAGMLERFGASARVQIGATTSHQQALPVAVGVADAIDFAEALQVPATRVRHQDAWRVGTRPQSFKHQDAQRMRTGATSREQQAERLQTWGSAQRHQDALHLRAGGLQRFQRADPVRAGFTQHEGVAQAIGRSWRVRYQSAMKPPPGTSPSGVLPPALDPCYVPSTALLFSAPWVASTDLVFVCERHDGPVEPGATIVVPVRRIYTVINNVTLRRVDGNVMLPRNNGLTLTLDDGSWTWGFSASMPGSALADLEPNSVGEPVEIEAMINGVAYRALIESIGRDRTFGRSDIRISGRGKAAFLDAPYAPALNFGNPVDAMTAAQLAAQVLTFNGSPIGWDLDWTPEDWLVPAGAWSHQGTYISALNAIAAAAGAYLQPHRVNESLSVLLRYPVAPWDWAGVTPDYELPADPVQRESIEWVERARYNRVYVSGVSAGVIGQVTRAGTAGDLVAPMVVDQLITSDVAARQRGLPVLADVGRQALLSLRLPILAETGIIPPGKFVRFVDGDTTRIGLTRSVSVDAAYPAIWQTIGVETHVSI